MGNTCKRCFGIRVDNKGQYVRASYGISKEFSIEFEQLMENPITHETTRPADSVHSPFTVSSYMRWLSAQEDALREEEEAQFSRGMRPLPASSVEALHSTSGATHGSSHSSGYHRLDDPPGHESRTSSWVLHNNAEWGSEEELDGPEMRRVMENICDVEMGLATVGTTGYQSGFSTEKLSPVPGPDRDGVKLNSIQAKIHQQLLHGGGRQDANSASSTREVSSLDLDWDHEPGMDPSLAKKHVRSVTEEDLQHLGSQRSNSSEEYLWENDVFVNVSTDKRHLLSDL